MNIRIVRCVWDDTRIFIATDTPVSVKHRYVYGFRIEGLGLRGLGVLVLGNELCNSGLWRFGF